MTVDEVQRRVREARDCLSVGNALRAHGLTVRLYYDTLCTLLDHDLPDDARQLIEAALEAER